MNKGTINNWSLQSRSGGMCIVGTSEGHPDAMFEDGSPIRTSVLVEVDPEAETVTTQSGSVYKLGTVDPAYELAFPNAHARFFISAKEGILDRYHH